MNSFIEEVRDYLRRITARRPRVHVTAFSARLPAAPRETCFHTRLQVAWPIGKDINVTLRSLAEQKLLQAVRATATCYSVLDPDEARAAINLELGRNLHLKEEDVWLADASVTEMWVDPADRQMAEAQEAFRRETALARTQQQEKLERLRILSDQVLSDPALAGLWWLDGQPDKLPELVKLGKNKVFEEAATLFSASPGRAAVDPIPELVRLFLHDLGPDLRQQLIERLHLVFISYERTDLARQLDPYRQMLSGNSGQDGLRRDMLGCSSSSRGTR